LTSMFTLMACLLALLSPTVEVYYMVFIFMAFTQSLIQVSRLTIVAEMCSEEELPIYAALTNILTVPFILTGILAGWLAQLFGFALVFIISSAVSLFALAWYYKKVEEPRSINSFSLVTKNN
ncbi:MAG: MFS transporter, partial [Bacteroidota bacterium]